VGPTIENVHSPAERLFIPSVARTMDLLIATLEES
jgi:di/tripeptidase